MNSGARKATLNPKIPLNDKGLTYSSYLKVKELISLQNPLTTPVAHDELLFIVIHQVYELWFKLTIFELKSLIANLDQDNLIQSFHILKSCWKLVSFLQPVASLKKYIGLKAVLN